MLARRPLRLPRPALLALGLSLAACGGADPTGEAVGALGGSVGVLHVERSVEGGGFDSSGPAGEEPRADRTVLRAAFARYEGLEGPDVLALLGSGPGLSAGRCELAGGDTEPLPASARVDLLDVGDLHVGVAGSEARLAPRSFPELASVLAGVIYAGDADLAPPAPQQPYRFRAEGGFEMEGFEVDVPAPPAVEGVALLGADGTGAELDGARLEVERTAALTVLWAGGDDGDGVEVELSAGDQVLVCAAPDEGQLVLPGELVAALPADADARLRVRRVHVESLALPGLEQAFARVTVGRTFGLDLR